jgi:acetyl esterase/lipase
MSKKSYILVLIIFSYSWLLPGCTRSSLFLANTLAKLDDYTLIKNHPYKKGQLNTLDIYIPDLAKLRNTKMPVVIFFYGGCWGGCTTFDKSYYQFVGQAMTSKHFIAVIGNYRRYPEVTFQGIIKDSQQIVTWVKQNIAQYSGDPNRLFLMGHSSGAHLAAMLTVDKNQLDPKTYQSIKGFIGLAGAYDFLPLTAPYQKVLFGPVEKYPESQPINFVSGTEPPVLLLHGHRDKITVPENSINLSKEIKKMGGLSYLKIYKDMNHTDILSALALPFQETEMVLSDISDFITEYSLSDKQNEEKTKKFSPQR